MGSRSLLLSCLLLGPLLSSCGLLLEVGVTDGDAGADGGTRPPDAGTSAADATPTVDAADGRADADVADAVSPGRDASASCTSLCADANGDGSVGPLDAEAVRMHLAGDPAPICLDNADVAADGVVDGRDLYLLRHLASGVVSAGTACAVCPHACGDADGNGAIDRIDVDCLVRSCTFALPHDACELLTADVNRDGSIDARDGLDLEEAILRGGTVCVP